MLEMIIPKSINIKYIWNRYKSIFTAEIGECLDRQSVGQQNG